MRSWFCCFNSAKVAESNKKNEDERQLIPLNHDEPKLKNFEKIGIYNEGNTCYMNSVFQCVFHNAFVREHISQNKKTNHEEDSIASVFIETLTKYQEEKNEQAISVSRLLQTFQRNPNFIKVKIFLKKNSNI